MPRLSSNKCYRLLEMIPAILVWGTFIGAIILSIYAPLWAIYFIIIFDLYWLIKAIYWLVYLFSSYANYRRDVKINWLEKIKSENPKSTDGYAWDEMYHLIFLPTYREPYEVLETTFQGLVNSHYPAEKFMIALGVEERDQENGWAIAEKIKAKFGDKFFRFWITVHPANIPNEVALIYTRSRCGVKLWR